MSTKAKATRQWTSWFTHKAFPGFEFKKVTQTPLSNVQFDGNKYFVEYKMATGLSVPTKYICSSKREADMIRDWFLIGELVIGKPSTVLLKRVIGDKRCLNTWADAKLIKPASQAVRNINGVEF